MKMKFFLRGLGIGVIVTALLLCIFYRQQMTDANIIKQAKHLGMEFPDEQYQKNVDTTSGSAVATASPSATAEPKTTATPKSTAEPSATPTKTTAPDDKEFYSLTISGGLDSSAVAKQLEQAKVIKSAKEFDNYLTSKGFGERIVVGKFKIPVGSSYADIARIITK